MSHAGLDESTPSWRDNPRVLKLILVRNAAPLKEERSSAADWPLTDQGKHDASTLGTKLSEASPPRWGRPACAPQPIIGG
jgi:hypothetical protein